MPVYQYEGKHYSLPEGLSDEQAISKIKAHLGETQQSSPPSQFSQVMQQSLGQMKDALGMLPIFGGHVPQDEGLRGPGEAIAHIGTSIPAFAAGIVGAGVEKPIAAAFGNKVAPYDQRVAEMADRLTFNPKTNVGQDLSEPFDELMSRVGPAMLGHMGDIEAMTPHSEAPVGKPGDITPPKPGFGEAVDIGLRTKPKKKTGLDVEAAMHDVVGDQGGGSISTPSNETPLPDVMPVNSEGQGIAGPNDALYKAEAERRAALVAAARPVEGRDLSDPFGSMKQQLGTDQSLPPEPNPVMASLANRLQGEQPSPLRSQMELPFEQREQLDLQQQPMDLPQQQAPAIPTQQPDMFGPLMDLKSQGEMAPGVKRPATGEDMAQGELDVTEPQLALNSEGEMAPKPPPEPVKGQQQDMIGPDLTLDPNAKFPPLPKDSMYAADRLEALKREQAVLSDPRVQETAARMEAARDQFIKAAQDYKEGKIGLAQADKLSKEADMAREAHEFVKQQVRSEMNLQARKAADIASPGPLSSQRGAVDIGPLADALKKAIAKLSQFDFPSVRSAIERFNITNNPKEFSDAMKAAKADGQNGEMARALNDAYTAAADKTIGDVENLREKQMSRKPPGPRPGWKGPKNQRGSILLEGPKTRALTNLADKIGIEQKLQEIAPSQMTLEDAIDAVKKGQDLNQGTFGNLLNYLTKGGEYMALKTHNPMIRFVVERFLEADRLARGDTARWLHAKDDGLNALMRNVNNKELADAWHLISFADLLQKPIDLIKLAERGASQAQIALIRGHREAMDYALQMINKARAAAGQEPLTPRVAYAAMQSTGDFRRLVYNTKGGNIIGVISSNFRPKLNRLKEQMEAKGYYVDSERYFGGERKQTGSANDAFARATEMLANNDPKIREFVDVLDQVRKTEISNFLNMKRHTMEKKGIFGMEGRKDWESGYQNAVDGFKAQTNYMEAAIKWGHLSEAFKDAQALLKAPEAAHMKMAKVWAEKYMYNALGYNPSEVGRSVENAVATMFDRMGLGYSVARRTMAIARQYTNSLLLTLRPAFWYQNVVQPLMAMPGMKADLIARGLDAGFDFGTGASYIGQGTNTAIRLNARAADLTPFEKAAEAYARKYHVYGTDLVEHSNSIRKNVGYRLEQINNATSGSIESATRRVMFHSFVHMLKENGMSEKNGLFTAAHNLTDMSMNNYSALERPQIYNSLGPVGDVAVNLQSYKHNELSRLALFVRDSKEFKSLRPVSADLMARFVSAGVLGMIGYNNADAIVHFVSKMMGHPVSLSDLVFRASEGANKFLYDKTGGRIDAPYALSNGIHSMLGLDLSKSLGVDTVIPDNIPDLLFPGASKVAGGIKSLYTLTGLPGGNNSAGLTAMNVKRAVYDNAPLVAQGPLNNAWFTKGEGNNRVALRTRDLAAASHRSDADYMKKELGFTGINESVERQKTYNVERLSRDYADLRQGPLDRMRDSLLSQGKFNGKDVANYVKYRGSVDTLTGDLMRYEKDQSLTPQQLAYMKAQSTSSVAALIKAQDYARAFSK